MIMCVCVGVCLSVEVCDALCICVDAVPPVLSVVL